MEHDADLRAAIGGDQAAFARIYRRYARAVFLDLAARLRRREDAEDALQATFLAAWTNLPRLRDPRRLTAWLFRIARNRARDCLRRERAQLIRLGDRGDLIAPATGDRPEVEALRDLMAGLRPGTRAIVLLRAVEGWSAAEVAAAQGLSASTVRRRYASALTHLREALERRTQDERRDRDTRPIGL